ncbi:hypothetical protein [Sphingomonas lenta]|uniref:Uncharacterized protein n=1 Tax=Sphingomonas lenta TaxID=1141887 RepID=A0A2A2SD56_9SPHN|nr:hypothetical protein [Sphingomonas lenta]PAX06941.1 hypothetical protein CKY28_12795 [Sphingomonas lenta]
MHKQLAFRQAGRRLAARLGRGAQVGEQASPGAQLQDARPAQAERLHTEPRLLGGECSQRWREPLDLTAQLAIDPVRTGQVVGELAGAATPGRTKAATRMDLARVDATPAMIRFLETVWIPLQRIAAGQSHHEQGFILRRVGT